MKVSYVEDLADHHGLERYAERGNSLGVVSVIRETQAMAVPTATTPDSRFYW